MGAFVFVCVTARAEEIRPPTGLAGKRRIACGEEYRHRAQAAATDPRWHCRSRLIGLSADRPLLRSLAVSSSRTHLPATWPAILAADDLRLGPPTSGPLPTALPVNDRRSA